MSSQMKTRKFVAGCLVVLFICGGISYSILGFGSWIDADEGQAGLFRFDRWQIVEMARSILSGDFGFYSSRMIKVDMLSAPGGLYNYPPLTPLLEAPIVLASDLMDMDDAYLFNVSILPFILLTGLAAFLVAGVFERYTGKELTSDAVVLIAIFLFSGLLFYSVVKEGKFEGVVAFFGLLGMLALPERKILSGICFGLAMCTKQVAILFVIPTFFVLCNGRRYVDVLKWSLSLGLTVLLIMSPFLWGSGMERVYLSLSKNMDLFKIQENSAMGYLYKAIMLAAGGERPGIEEFLQLYANKLLILLCIVASFVFTVTRKITISTPERYFALLAFCSFTFITFGKFYTAGIYEVVPTFIFVLWAAASGETVFGAAILLLQSFFCCNWPLGFYKNEILLLLYFGAIIYIWHSSLRNGETMATLNPKP